jgi:hypothetical protein
MSVEAAPVIFTSKASYVLSATTVTSHPTTSSPRIVFEGDPITAVAPAIFLMHPRILYPAAEPVEDQPLIKASKVQTEFVGTTIRAEVPSRNSSVVRHML